MDGTQGKAKYALVAPDKINLFLWYSALNCLRTVMEKTSQVSSVWRTQKKPPSILSKKLTRDYLVFTQESLFIAKDQKDL